MVEMSIVLVVIGIILSISFSILPGATDFGNAAATKTEMESIVEAIEGFALANNRLPGPAATGTSGVEVVGGSGTASSGIGFLPFTTLGLNSGADAWGNYYRYAIYVSAAATDLSDPLDNGGTSSTSANFCQDLQTAAAAAISTGVLHIASPTDSTCSSNETNVAFVVMSPGRSESKTSAGADDSSDFNTFNGNNATAIGGVNLCVDNPTRKMRASGTGSDQYDDIVKAYGLTTMIGRLNCTSFTP
ncbi:hypothetical protein MAIT1_01572 [Magnetofaba australis IT-1]|uniref:Prepilin-type N-terminal cleavage/methylation domain-containing protein n=2 Tax=Magnetofaba TaxID=1472292 RepID=A0A1Y2K335_9PROT|nr:hypothetical protein MAIT1_01572 [Magnetofaba australis IT-1]